MIMASLSDAASPPVLAGLAAWVEAVLTGTWPALLASIAVAALGYAMFTGRLPLRQALATLLGCFLLLGAPGISRALRGQPEAVPAAMEQAPRATAVSQDLPVIPPEADPYAGAGLFYSAGDPK
jgi:type IV secretion system protein VirB2